MAGPIAGRAWRFWREGLLSAGLGALGVAAAILATPGVLAKPLAAVEVPAPLSHPTILSINPCTDAILAEVADPAQIRALSAYSGDPAQSSMSVAVARRFPSTGGTVEEILSAHPDVVVAGGFVAPATRSALSRLGIPVVEFGVAHKVAQSIAQVRALARLAGQPARGEALVARMMAAVAGLSHVARQARVHPTALVWQSGGMVAGPDALVVDLLRQAGFADYAAARGLSQAQILGLEPLLADPPDVVLVAANPNANEDRMLRHPALAALTSTRRVAFDPALEWCGGPTVVRAAARILAIRRAMVGAPGQGT